MNSVKVTAFELRFFFCNDRHIAWGPYRYRYHDKGEFHRGIGVRFGRYGISLGRVEEGDA
jgi:hypothetical protein